MPHAPLFSLSHGVKYVIGHKHTLIINFKTNTMEKLESEDGTIISLLEKGCSLDDITSVLKCSRRDMESRLENLLKKGILKTAFIIEREEEKLKPLKLDKLWLEVTGRCNLNCTHCYTSASMGKCLRRLDLKYDDIIKTIHESAELECKHIQFTGGEPTLRKDLKKMIKEAKKSWIPKIEVFTNAVSISDDLINFFKRESIELTVSFYSHRENIHDLITGVKGSYRAALKNLKLISGKGVNVSCEVTLMKANMHDFSGTSRLLKGVGVEMCQSHPIFPVGRGINEETQNLKKFCFMKGGPPFFISDYDFWIKRNWNSCWYGKAAVAFNGDVIPCPYARQQVAGNVKHECFSDIIRGKMRSFWVMNKDKVDVCRDCEYRYSCNNCLPLTFSLTGSLTSKPPYCSYNPYTGVES